MKSSTVAKFQVGDEVEVSFKGKVVKRDDVSFNHVAVAADGYVHHVHRYSDDVKKVAPPRPEVELGQVWRANGRNFLAYSNLGHGMTFCGTNDVACVKARDEKFVYEKDEFFQNYPDAILLLNADGSSSPIRIPADA